MRLTGLVDRLLSVFDPEPLPAPEMLPPARPSPPRGDAFSGTVPETYALTRAAYPFLPPADAQLERLWAGWTPGVRAAFILDYVGRVYAGVGVTIAALEAKGVPVAPTVVFRTTDHPMAHTRPPGLPPGTDAYSLWFDTDMGSRIEVHMGPVVFGRFVTIARDWSMQGRRAS